MSFVPVTPGGTVCDWLESETEDEAWDNRPIEQELEAEVERYKTALQEIREIYTGMDGFWAQTPAEGYLHTEVKRIWRVAREALAND